MSWIEFNKPFLKGEKPTKWRRLAVGSWGAPNNPTIYGIVEVNVEKALRSIEHHKKESGEKITINHFVGKVFAQILKKYPEMNCELRMGKFYPRKNIDISFQVAIEHEHDHHPDLSAGLVQNMDQKSIAEIARDLNSFVKVIRKDHDPQFSGLKKLSGMIPGFMQTFAVAILKFILNTLNLWSPIFGVPKNAFGSILVTSVGSLGLDLAIPALFPPANVPMIIAVGAIFKGPVYETNHEGIVTQIKLERFVKLCGAFDHRYVDGMHASRFTRDIRYHFEHPESWG